MVKKRSEQAAVDAWLESWGRPAFTGDLEFDLVLEFLGRRDTKRCKVVYAFTPEWPFYDPNTKTVREETETCSYHVEIKAVPELRQKADGTWKLGKPYWIHFEDFIRDDVLSHDMRDAILNAIEERCRLEDVERRRTAGKQLT
jgi:hypothetical protein